MKFSTSLLLKFFDYFHLEIVEIKQERIGHLVAESDWYIKKNLLDGVKKRPIFILRREKVANKAYVNIMQQRFFVVKQGFLRKILRRVKDNRSVVVSTRPAVSGSSRADYFRVFSEYHGRPNPWTVPGWVTRKGKKQLREMGVPEGAWFVCVHSREGGYSPSDEYAHSHRNSNIQDYMKAIEYVTSQGGWCIRIGDATMAPLPPMERTIDYALSPFKADWMDIFLCSNARYLIGNSSGISILCAVFGVPSVLANLTPLSTAFGVHPKDINIPKLLLDKEGEVLGFKSIFDSSLADLRFANTLADLGVSFVNNSPDDILAATIEMEQQLNGDAVSEETRKLQQDFLDLVKPQHYCYGATSNISASFIEKYKDLLNK